LRNPARWYFVVSPEAVKSKQCTWEVEPDVRTVKDAGYLQVGSRKLRRLLFVPFDSGTGFARPLSQLTEALRVDLRWIREHIRLGEIATRWDKRGLS